MTQTGPSPSGSNRPFNKNGTFDETLKEWLDIISNFLSKVPQQVGKFFSDYRQPLLTLLLIISGIVTVYITLAVLDAIDDIPLLAPLLELVGLAYTAWFVYRYLWKATSREELWVEFEALKAQIVGSSTNLLASAQDKVEDVAQAVKEEYHQ